MTIGNYEEGRDKDKDNFFPYSRTESTSGNGGTAPVILNLEIKLGELSALCP